MKTWLLMTGDRWTVAGVQLIAVVAAMVVVGAAATGSGAPTLVDGDPVQTLFQALVAGIVTGVTLVLTVNQLVLSQEFGALADQRERLRGAMDYRQDADDFTGGEANPAEPAAFLVELVGRIAELGRSLAEEEGRRGHSGRGADDGSAVADGDTARHAPVAEYGERVARRAAEVGERLRDRSFGDFAMLWTALHYDYSRQIQEGRALLRDPDGGLSQPVRERVEAVVEGLVLFGSAREHFKTLFFERDLIDLSRGMLALALPALLVAALVLLYFDPAAISEAWVGVPGAVWVLSLAVAVSLAPFVLLLSFILRIATVTRRTMAAGPFVLHPDQGRGGSIEAQDG